MDQITLSCPHCGFSKQIDQDRIPDGTNNIKCPKCKQSFPLEQTFKFGPEPSSTTDSPRAEVTAGHETARASQPKTGAQQTATKFCSTCGQQIHLNAEICPGCGVRVAPRVNAVNKVALLLITFFLGGLGGHKFYQKKYGLGVLYLLFFWTYIPSLAALVEFIIYAFKSETELQQRYPETSSGVIFAVVLSFVGIAIIGILAAIAIPQFVAYRAKAYNAAATSDLRACKTQAESYFADQQTYPLQKGQLQCQTSKGVALYYLPLGKDEYQIISFHTKGSKAFLIGGDNAEMSENTRQEIEDQLSQSYGTGILQGSFHFIE